MKTLYILDTVNKIGETVTLSGWVYSIRDHKKVIFIDLIDRSGIIQIVGDESMSVYNPQDVIHIEGTVKKRPDHMINKKISTGEVEIEVKKHTLISKAETLPVDISKADLDVTLPVLLDYRSLTLRHPKVRGIFKVQEVVINTFRKAMQEKGFFEFQSPVIIPQTAEGGADVFEVKYFNHTAYLSQSPQFYKQIMVGVFEKVFTVNKTLRAEPSVTTRHLTEVTTLDAEFGFVDSWEEIMDVGEYVIKYILDEVENKCRDILSLYNITIPLVSKNIPRIKLRQAQEIILNKTGRDNRGEPDLQPDDEREICKWSKQEHKSDLVFITHYPVEKRPFYTYEDEKNKGYTLSFDLIGKGFEWMTGGQRIHDIKELVKKARERNISLEKSELYLQAFRYGMPPEGGFSYGSERIVMGILELANIRQASLFPRDMERIDIHLPSIKNDQQTKEKIK